MKGIIEEAPDDFPVFTMPNASHPSTFARIVDIPSSTSSLPQVAQNEARELQNAGVYNAMGFIVVIVKVFEMAESDTADGSLYEAANTASNLMTMALRVAPELVLLGLEKMGVSQSLRFTQMLIFAGATTSTRACEQGTFVEQLSCWRTRRQIRNLGSPRIVVNQFGAIFGSAGRILCRGRDPYRASGHYWYGAQRKSTVVY